MTTVSSSNFSDNRAGEGGGAVYVGRNNIAVSVSHSYFGNNSISAGTRGVAGQNTNVSVVNSTFGYNSATSCGVLDIHDVRQVWCLLPVHLLYLYNTATGQSIGGGVVCVKFLSWTVPSAILCLLGWMVVLLK